ncbi:MAG TPA: pyruvate, phosphate dikinase, partial [Geminicoccaceae bacterium]|nr:pyruvate, phosphate dikinase [Geminicoccaceae bacterium]
MGRWVYRFGRGRVEGDAKMTRLLGGKGANLAEMSNLGLPVPPGFTITTEVCTAFYANDRNYPEGLAEEVEGALRAVEEEVGAGFGDPARPLLVSVRSGAPVSMPGMMDTVLNLGLNDGTVEGVAALADDPRFAYDSYRRFIQMYGNVVLGVRHDLFEDRLDELKDERAYELDTELSADDWRELVGAFKEVVGRETGKPFPQDVRDQLWGAIGAVFGSWQNPRAVTYRRLHNIDPAMGTAVTVQAMVFGNMGDTSATGVAFTRDPSTGEGKPHGEFLVNAQGEDVVAGIRTPQPLTEEMRRESGGVGLPSMEQVMPRAFAELLEVFDRLERHYRDMQDIEFTVQRDQLYILQTRSGKRTAHAALKVAVDMVREGLIAKEQAVARVEPGALDQLLHPTLDPSASHQVIARGLAASPGAVSGRAVFSADEAERRGTAGEAVILVRAETSPDDIHGMHAARGILTSRGGTTSHAAVVARGMGKACVCGASEILVDAERRRFTAGGVTVEEGDVITIDGAAGTVMLGAAQTVQPELSGDFGTLMAWADEIRRLGVRANAETPEDARTALRFGAEGIGLCRTEHMFFEEERIVAVREMILAGTTEGRRAALAKIEPMQRRDFVELFKIMGERPVTIRLLDPPLHEFLPHSAAEIAAVAKGSGLDPEALRRRAVELQEANPMLGLRGCRLGILFPEIYEMQARAILEAVVEVRRETGRAVVPEIMVPLVGTARELALVKAGIDAVAREVAAPDDGGPPEYQVGTMIEVPRAAFVADAIAEHATFFSFGTNDLTQMGMGLSRDDAGRFMDAYVRHGIFAADPFMSLDVEGVGAMVEIAVERGRRA